MKVQSSGKYLGIHLGPGAGDTDWDAALAALTDISDRIGRLGLPKHTAILMYHMFAISKTQFMAQVRTPPALWVDLPTGSRRKWYSISNKTIPSL